MTGRLAVLALLGLIAGCATKVPLPEFESPNQALVFAEDAEEAGRWGEAVAALDTARKQFPGEGRLVTKYNEVDGRWRELKRLWEDRLAVARARAALDEIERLAPLVTAEPDRVWLSFQKTQRQRTLRTVRGTLLDCGERWWDEDIDLAKTCVTLADRIWTDEVSTSLLATIEARIKARAEEVRLRKLQEERTRRESLLTEAEERFEQGDYHASSRLVDNILTVEPDNRRALLLKQNLDETTTEQNTVLNELAARKYSQQDIDTAIRLWQASLRIRRDQPDIRERLNRALRIQENLEVLRRTKPLRDEPAAGAQ